MPKRLSDNGGESEHERGGYSLRYTSPHSPFQLLLERARAEKDALSRAQGRGAYSVRRMALDLGVTQSSLWIWIHNKCGYPSEKAFDRAGMFERIVQVLGIPAEKLAWALDESRQKYVRKEGSIPDPTLLDAFRQFIEDLEKTPSRRILRETWLDKARRLYFGAQTRATAGNPPAPDPKTPPPVKAPPKKRPPRKGKGKRGK